MNVQGDGPSTVVLGQAKPLVPGYLITPFGWAAQPLAALVQLGRLPIMPVIARGYFIRARRVRREVTESIMARGLSGGAISQSFCGRSDPD
jgi:hypothetical protein